MFASHHWPRWGNERIQEVLRDQRDLYAHMNNQVLHLANQGVTINQVHNVYQLPQALQQKWHCRGYLLTFKLVGLALFAGAVSVIAMIRWGWDLEPKPPSAEVDIGGGIKLPTYMSGPRSHSWWAVSILLLAAAALYLSYVFSYLYLWTVAPGVWPSAADVLYGSFAEMSAGLFVVSSVGMLLASHTLRTANRSRQWTFPALVIGSLAALSVGLVLEVYGHWSAGLRPTINSFAALTYTGSLLQGTLVVPALAIGVYTLA